MPRLLAVLFLLAACGAFAAERPDNFVQWRPGLASSAQPSGAWLGKARQSGYDLVINLAAPTSPGWIANERALVVASGAAYLGIPIDFAHPKPDDFRRFSDALKANAGRNVFVHCALNWRSASFIFLHRVLNEGVPLDHALDALYAAWSPDPVWKKFIEDTLAASGKKVELM